MANTDWNRRGIALLMGIIFIGVSFTMSGKDLILTVSGPETQPTAGQSLSLWLNALNTSTQTVSWPVPGQINGRLQAEQSVTSIIARLRPDSQADSTDIAPGTFARREYTFEIPETITGEATLQFSNLVSANLVLDIQPPAPIATDQKRGLLYFFQGHKHAGGAGEYDPDGFFKQHIFGYEPFYFIAGTKSPNAKFQISFKYQLLNEEGWLAGKMPWLTGFHVGYSQTSLWDWNNDSAPFFDSSYRPEFLYSKDRVLGGGPMDWFRLDLQTGVQHESNGKDGTNSRSLNIVYFSPRLTFGKDTGLQLKLTPRAWIYIGDLSDNPDIADYRGYVDLRAALGWKRGLQLSALGRIGDQFDHASGQFDLTYPLMQPPSGSFSVYLQIQYFTGYGESLLGYKEKTDILRAGFSLYR